MTDANVRLRTVFALAAEIEDESDNAIVASPSETVSDEVASDISAVLAQSAPDLTTWSSDEQLDELLTLGARMSVSAESAMIEGAARATADRSALVAESDAVETLLQLISAVPSIDDPTLGASSDGADVERQHRRIAADDLAHSVEGILTHKRTPGECDENVFNDLIRTVGIDFGAALAGITAATTYQHGMEQHVVYRGRTVSAAPIDWTPFLTGLAKLLGLEASTPPQAEDQPL